MFSNREEAILAWNTRAEPPELITLGEQVKVQPACDEAIREYEEAQNPSNQANLGDVPETNFGDIPGHKETLK